MLEPCITDELDLLTLGTFTGPAGTFRQTAELTKTQRDLLAKLKITGSAADALGQFGLATLGTNLQQDAWREDSSSPERPAVVLGQLA